MPSHSVLPELAKMLALTNVATILRITRLFVVLGLPKHVA